MAKQKLKGPRKLSNAGMTGAAAEAVVLGQPMSKAKAKLPGKRKARNIQTGASRGAGTVTKQSLKVKVKSPRKKQLLAPSLDPIVGGASVERGLPVAGAIRRTSPRAIRPSGRLERLEAAIEEVRLGTRTSPRTRKLLSSGIPKMAQKVIEEAAETAIEAIRGDRAAFILESVDLFYNFVALCSELGVPIAEIWAEMDRRELALGMAEKTPKIPDAGN